jgi:hypothetical protein
MMAIAISTWATGAQRNSFGLSLRAVGVRNWIQP